MAENDAQVPGIQLGTELTDEQLNVIAGGYLFYCGEGTWEIIGSKGNVVCRMTTEGYGDRAEVESLAESLGLSTKVLTWDALNRLRTTGSL